MRPRVGRFGLSHHAGLYCGSMPKLKTDEQLLKHLEERAPEVLAARVNFDALVGRFLPLVLLTLVVLLNAESPSPAPRDTITILDWLMSPKT